MYKDNLYKGFEIELFTGTYNSHVGVSDQIEKLFSDFVKEPDNRNVEYITNPHKSYQELHQALLKPRKKLRKWLKEKDLTIIPSSTLCFSHDNKFQRSDEGNVYHQFIESNYGIKIATSSVHINLGVDNLQKLFAAIRLARCEASLYLSLSASSPFLDGKFTGNHSQRWIQFPKTPSKIPFFTNQQQYIDWIENNLKCGKIHNIRHFWSSIRPNGPKRPYELDRLELRICDFIADIDLLLSITSFLEIRTLYLFNNIKEVDPIHISKFSLDELQVISDQNELEAAKRSLNSELIHWKDGQKIICKDWIENLLDEMSVFAKKLNMYQHLEPIYNLIEDGNQSMKWIEKYNKGFSIEDIMKFEIDNMMKNE
tara:strand:- start:5725 stop:6831 length:1107 start_codon:yes stop_codon:yes gene_type:complete